MSGRRLQILATAASTAVKCAALALLIAGGDQREVTTHLETCSTCQHTQAGGRS